MADIPIESPFKYGRFEGDGDEFADLINNGATGDTKRSTGVHPVPVTSEVDADVLREAFNSTNKYGRG